MATLSSNNHVISDVDDDALMALADLAGEEGKPVGEVLNEALAAHLEAAAKAKKSAKKPAAKKDA